MIIRDLKRKDINNIKELAYVVWEDTYSSIIPLEIQNKTILEAYSEESMNKRFQDSKMLVAEMNEKIVGYAFFSGNIDSKEVYLESIYVDPSYQKRGIGLRLLNEGLSRFTNYNKITLTIMKGNINLTFYEKLNFSPIKELNTNFSGHPVTFIKMEKTI